MKAARKTALGIVGYGVMGSAMARAVIRSEDLNARFAVTVLARDRQKSAREDSVRFAPAMKDLAAHSDVILLAVRPEQVNQTIADIVSHWPARTPDQAGLLISLAAGVPLAALREAAGDKLVVARVMPNTLLEVNKGLFGVCAGPGLSGGHRELMHFLFSRLGTVIELEERQMNSFTALAGCGPGFLFYIMDSLSEAGVSIGLSREASQSIAVGLMGGCAELASSTGLSPALLREQSLSPSGMTIAGTNHLDRCGVRGHIIDGVKTACERGNAMDKEA